jgi:dCMP deaminase
VNNKWLERFKELTHLISSWSKDPSTKVGAVIVDKKNRIISTGYNGFPASIPDNSDSLLDRDFKLDVTIHAEENAILFSNVDLADAIIFVTHFPCPRCASKMIQVGISRVYVTKRDESFEERWKIQIARSRLIFSHAGVIIEYV